jgi:hypothetical protein
MPRLHVTPSASRRFATLLATLALFAATPARSAGVFYVDNSSGSCSDAGPGTELAPYCTISAAVAAHSGPGTTIHVKPGTYREQVTVPLAGAPGSPYVIQALGGPVIVDGADDFSSPAQWVQYSGDVYLCASETWTLSQVFMDGVRLNPSAIDPAFLPANSYNWVQGQGLYVNARGDNPGSHQLLAGRRQYGFLAAGRNYLTIDGFTILHSELRGIQLNNSCTNVTLSHNTVQFAFRYGIQAVGGSGDLITNNLVTDCGDHGIMLLTNVTASTVQSNETARNAQPNGHAANGIHLFGSPANVVQNNRTHDNQDTGIQIDGGSNNCVVRQNMSWNNGDHGFDNINSTGTSIVGNDTFGNSSDGFSIDGTSTGVSLYDCIAIENGIGTRQFDLWVDAGSTPGFISDYNIFWNSGGQAPIKYSSSQYLTLPAYSTATGQDSHSIQHDPGLMNPWTGDFRLVSGSVAIDDANSMVANWSDTDAAGNPRVDDPATSNLGTGPLLYGDRGAMEFQATSVIIRPNASMVVTPSTGTEPLPVSADASGSNDADGGIATYQFDFGDGTTVGPQASPIATHTYAAGNWTASVIVTDNQGAASSTSVLVLVGASSPMNLALNSSFEVNTDGWDPFGASALSLVPGGYDGAQALQMTGTATNHAVFGVNDHNDWVRSVPAVGTQYRFSAWVMSPSGAGQAQISVNEYVLATGEAVGAGQTSRVTLSTTWQMLTLDYVAARQGTTLDFQIRDYPVAVGETFMTDAISIYDLGLTSTSAGDPPAPTSLAPMLYPSPLRTSSTLRFATSRPGRLRVEILDLAGRHVRRLIDEPQASAGVHLVSVNRAGGRDGPALGPGVYFYRVDAADGVKSGRFVVLR